MIELAPYQQENNNMRQTTLLTQGWLFRRGDSAPECAYDGEDGWQAVSIPHDWAIEGPFDGWNEPKPLLSPEMQLSFTQGNDTGALPYIGCGTYVRELIFENSEKDRVQRLEFDGETKCNAKSDNYEHK